MDTTSDIFSKYLQVKNMKCIHVPIESSLIMVVEDVMNLTISITLILYNRMFNGIILIFKKLKVELTSFYFNA